MRTAAAYKDLHQRSDRLFRAFGPVGRAVFRGVRGGTHGFLSRFTNNEALYSNLDIKYLGPIDGHDLPALLETLELAKSYGAPVIVHTITEKGRGYQPPETTRPTNSMRWGRSTPRRVRRCLPAVAAGPTCSRTPSSRWGSSAAMSSR